MLYPRRARWWVGAALGWFLVAAAGCLGPASEDPPDAVETDTSVGQDAGGLHLTRIDEDAGIQFRHFNDASSRRRLPETMGAGVAFADFDGDGWADLFFVDGSHLEGGDTTGGRTSGNQLYRNRGDGTFANATKGSGLEVPIYGMGVAVGDVDRDGALDLFVSAVGQDRLFRNRGDGRFEDVTAPAGLLHGATGFASSAAFLDYDHDGDLDLFAVRYVDWSPATDRECRPDGVHRAYCTPETYDPVTNQLWRNESDGERIRFVDVSRDSGVAAHAGKGLGVLVFDHDGDGWDDILVANDTERNFLFRNEGDGSFTEIGVEAGIAYSESGAARGGMGVDGADLNRDGYPDVVIGNFSYEMVGYFRGRSSRTYLDEAPRFGIGLPTLPTLAFGLCISDLNRDGHEDVVVANGHIDPDIAVIYPDQTYAQPAQAFLNTGDGVLREVESPGGLVEPMVGRGLAAADYDRDGDPDLVITQNGAEARLFRNDTPGPAGSLRVRLVDVNGSVTPYGARVRVVGPEIPGGAIERELRSGGSYLSASEPVCAVAWPCDAQPCGIDSVLVMWPDGSRQLVDLAAIHPGPNGGQEIEVRQSRP